MEIYWLGHGCFRLKGRDATVVTDPCAPATGYKIGKISADIVTVSHDSPEANYRAAITGEAKFLSGPGEYEISNVLITAVTTESGAAESEGAESESTATNDRNVAFVIDLDDVRICDLGKITQVPTADSAEFLSGADVLFLPVGGGEVLDAEKAAKTVSLLNPKLVLPMIYSTEASSAQLDTVEKFLKEMSIEGKPPEQKVSVTKTNLPADLTVTLLNYRG